MVDGIGLIHNREAALKMANEDKSISPLMRDLIRLEVIDGLVMEELIQELHIDSSEIIKICREINSLTN